MLKFLRLSVLAVLVGTLTAAGVTANPRDLSANLAIKMNGYLQISREAAAHRASRRVTEEERVRMTREPNTIVLDALSAQRFNALHIEGAVNLSVPDITITSPARAIPDKNTWVLIYCNNNFSNAEALSLVKLMTASLSLSTFIALCNYGYRNVYERRPLIDIRQSKLPFELGI